MYNCGCNAAGFCKCYEEDGILYFSNGKIHPRYIDKARVKVLEDALAAIITAADNNEDSREVTELALAALYMRK